MANLVVKINSAESADNVRNGVAFGSKLGAKKFLSAVGSAIGESANLELQIKNDNAVAASATVTFSGAASADDTVIVNGVTFTGKASGAGANEFNVGLTATASALALKNAINSSVTALVAGSVIASVAAGVLTVTAVTPGVIGNYMTLAEGVDGGGVIAVSSARLVNGAEDTASSVNFRSW